MNLVGFDFLMYVNDIVVVLPFVVLSMLKLFVHAWIKMVAFFGLSDLYIIRLRLRSSKTFSVSKKKSVRENKTHSSKTK